MLIIDSIVIGAILFIFFLLGTYIYKDTMKRGLNAEIYLLIVLINARFLMDGIFPSSK
ncbi:MAG: hypothetical protein ACFFAH_16125 [Promethearchaeota archaeon]